MISLTGTTEPGSQLLLRTAAGQVRTSTYAGTDGRFALNVR